MDADRESKKGEKEFVKITITIIDFKSSKKLDIQVDNEQRIKTTLRVLSENIEEFNSFQNIKEVQIKNSGRRVSAELTYNEAEIYTGTEIVILKIPTSVGGE